MDYIQMDFQLARQLLKLQIYYSMKRDECEIHRKLAISFTCVAIALVENTVTLHLFEESRVLNIES